ncbi:alpha/beta hydrolase [Phenylobacterium sp. LH3H17]|uniref:alpha/beta hydrolase n=1 Tax=Phenylobacterium sp. LH3H17 TaxID=2903901 RepID=UPI0020C95EC8|nr:alpha/beta hydrolase [Phenylobacterium sp. LH3H17]UTP38502.1 alpha/beta hydrolase [Phenylobacterium sp. LH3H17]
MPPCLSFRPYHPTARTALIAAVAVLASACTPLGVFNTFVPHDSALRSATDQAYGGAPRQTLDVYAPRRIEAPRPIAVFFYGGSWETGRRQDYEWTARALAAKGFVVVLPDYRLYPAVRFPAFLEDGALAVRWAVDHGPAYGGDPSRIVLLGHSAGAYNAVMLALDDRYLKAAGVDPLTIRAVAGLAGPYDFLPLKGAGVTNVFGREADLAATQPATFARADAPPMFLATGEADAEVPPRDTAYLAAALRRAGASVEEHHYPGLDHNGVMKAIARPFRSLAPLLDEMSDFLREKAG